MKLTKKDFNFIHRDKQKEKSRQDKLESFHKTGVWPGSKPKPQTLTRNPADGQQGDRAWSDKADKKNRRDLRKLKKEIVRRKRKKGEEEEEEEDLGDLEEDYRMLKKMRRGKVRTLFTLKVHLYD